jgi:hypothetical protein
LHFGTMTRSATEIGTGTDQGTNREHEFPVITLMRNYAPTQKFNTMTPMAAYRDGLECSH